VREQEGVAEPLVPARELVVELDACRHVVEASDLVDDR
jgi:hypothetical protein